MSPSQRATLRSLREAIGHARQDLQTRLAIEGLAPSAESRQRVAEAVDHIERLMAHVALVRQEAAR